jgi:3-oxoacyl-[acyl-carrier-protein] synthase-3
VCCLRYPFGCPGWIEGVLQANAYIKSGMAQRCLVIGSETLSRVVDKHDRFYDLFRWCGASVIEASDDEETGLLSYESSTYAMDEANYLFLENHTTQSQILTLAI